MSKVSLSANLLVLALTLVLGGCASYYSHYAVFPATNSTGEPRQVKLSWQTAEYPDWWLASDKATAITLETQCSKRVWRLSDGTRGDDKGRGECGEGIRACGQFGVDIVSAGQGMADDSVVCMAISPDQPSARIIDLGRSFNLFVYCQPAEVQRVVGDDTENVDYLRPSAVPYQIDARKVPRGSMAARIPTLDDAICE